MKFLLTILVVIFVSSSAEDMLKELDDELYLDLLQQEGPKDGTVKADDIVKMQWDAKKNDAQSSSGTTFCKEKPNGNYPNPFKCEGFIMCSNHLTYFFDCPSILQYNPKTDRCDWPRNVNCGPAPRPTRPPRPPKPSPSTFCEKRANGNYVDPNNCEGFIMCSNHLTYFFQCPANLRYNAKTDRCDWPRNVKCGPTPRPTPRPTRPRPTRPRPTVTPSPSTFCKYRADGNYVDPNNCNGFIMCSNHLTYFFDCPANLRYNVKTDQCDWPWNVQCGPTPRPTHRPPPPTASPSTFCKNRPNGNYVDPNNCNGFIMCSNHLTYFFDCPANLRYNVKTDRCDWPWNVPCGPDPRPPRPPPTPSPSTFCKNRPNGNYVDPNNCNGFIMCSNHLTYFFDCPANLRYNARTDRCDWPWNVKCGTTPRPTRRPRPPTPSPSAFCKKRPNGNYVDPDNCNGFIMCSNHLTYFFDCPANLRYNVKTDRCDWPRNVKCATSRDATLRDATSNDEISSDTTARRSKFCLRHGDGRYRDITNCEGYIFCFSGFMFYRECRGNRRFNPLTRRCDLARNVKCGGAGGGTRGSGFCRGKANGDYKDVLNCNDFIKCSNGYTYYFDCPSDLRFNESTDRCDWPRNVPCHY